MHRRCSGRQHQRRPDRLNTREMSAHLPTSLRNSSYSSECRSGMAMKRAERPVSEGLQQPDPTGLAIVGKLGRKSLSRGPLACNRWSLGRLASNPTTYEVMYVTDTTPDLAVIMDAVALACRAPSLHNSQPWRWVAEGSTLHLHADLTRVMIAADPEGRQLYLSCGAALDHFTVAMAAAGWHTSVLRFPDALEPYHVATMEFRPATEADEGSRARAAAIGLRRTDRRPLADPIGWPETETQLRQAALPYHVMFDIVRDTARPSLARSLQAHRSDPSERSLLCCRVELVGTALAATGEGVPETALTSAAVSDRVDVKRRFPAVHDYRGSDDVRVDRSKNRGPVHPSRRRAA